MPIDCFEWKTQFLQFNHMIVFSTDHFLFFIKPTNSKNLHIEGVLLLLSPSYYTFKTPN